MHIFFIFIKTIYLFIQNFINIKYIYINQKKVLKQIKLLIIYFYFPKELMNSTSTESNLARKKIQNYSYQLNGQIGKGYSSQVFKGKNDLTNETVAVKVIDMKMIKGQVHKNLLASQIEVLRSLKNSENIIDVYDIYTTKNNTYIVTEICEQGDLAKMLGTRKSLPQMEAIDLMNQIINGYNHISNRAIIHRDLKPANIFLRQNQVKIADFGFAMKNSQSKKYSSYNVGSPIYMPPEALNDNKYSFKSDIWALGVIFYEMLTGKTPWRAKTQKQLGRQLLSVPIQKLLPKNLTYSSNDFLIRTLNININDRMSPQELSRFAFSNQKSDKQSTKHDLVSTNSIPDPKTSLLRSSNRIQTSLNRNTINTPKNMKHFPLLKTVDQPVRNNSLSKTFTKTQFSTNQNFNPSFNSTQKQLSSFKSTTSIVDKKIISKQLLSQIHFCRFLYKLLIRLESKLPDKLNNRLIDMKQQMCGLLFIRLHQIEQLKYLSKNDYQQYKESQDSQKVHQIVKQYQSKYQRDLINLKREFTGFFQFRQILTRQIVNLHQGIEGQTGLEVKQQVIVLDYLITLRQLLVILQQQNLQVFHTKSKMQQIVQGSPSSNITKEHIQAITSKLRTLKML